MRLTHFLIQDGIVRSPDGDRLGRVYNSFSPCHSCQVYEGRLNCYLNDLDAKDKAGLERAEGNALMGDNLVQI